MNQSAALSGATQTLPFDEFWAWLQGHPNCVLRVATPLAAIFDDEDYHWRFETEPDGIVSVQVIRGKRYVGEVLLPLREVAYVQAYTGEHEGEFMFDLFDEDNQFICQFVMIHGLDEGSEPSQPARDATPGRWMH